MAAAKGLDTRQLERMLALGRRERTAWALKLLKSLGYTCEITYYPEPHADRVKSITWTAPKGEQ